MTAIVVLGMHRSGTSCLAGMLAAAGLASAGHAVRGWDTLHGHHEMLDVVRLNEAVLAHSGGHWLSPPPVVRWTDEHATLRDRLLCARIEGRPTLVKDPRTLLTLPFWRASTVPFRVIAIVRHPLASARSLVAWRGMTLDEGVALWLAHNRALAADRAQHAYPLIDFERSRDEVVADVIAACHALGLTVDPAMVATAYDDRLVHHDATEQPSLPDLVEAEKLHRQLVGLPAVRVTTRRRFPHQAWADFQRTIREGERASAMSAALAAAGAIAEVSAVVVPAVSALLRRRWCDEAGRLVDVNRLALDAGLTDLLLGKIALAMGEPASAVMHLKRACAVPQPFFQARHLLPQALRQAGQFPEARSALQAVVTAALYPHGPLATLAEWAWLDDERAHALVWMEQAIASAPAHRRGRLRTRRAEWLLASGDRTGAHGELERAVTEDPAYGRARELLESWPPHP